MTVGLSRLRVESYHEATLENWRNNSNYQSLVGEFVRQLKVYCLYDFRIGTECKTLESISVENQ